MHQRSAGISLIAAAAVLASSGCVSNKKFERTVEDQAARIDSVESSIEANERRVGDLARDSDAKISSVRDQSSRAAEVGNQALAEAQEAQKLAQGKILWSVTLSDDKTRFGFGKSSVPEDARPVLDELASRVRSMDRTVYLEIEGHTDSTGNAEYNKVLGQERAEAVRDYLYAQGLPLHAMNVISFGEDQPVNEARSAEARAQNRRVVVKVLQ